MHGIILSELQRLPNLLLTFETPDTLFFITPLVVETPTEAAFTPVEATPSIDF